MNMIREALVKTKYIYISTVITKDETNIYIE